MLKLPPDTEALAAMLGQLPGFVIGLVSSALVAVPLYFKQKRESAATERRIILAIQQQQQQQAGHAPLLASTMSQVTEHHEKLLSQFLELREQFQKVVDSAQYDRAMPLALPYIAVARALATEKAERQLQQRPDTLELSMDSLRQLHAGLFPRGFELAGSLRNVPVWVGTLGTAPGAATFVPPPPSEVPKQLIALIEAWNRDLPKVRSATVEERTRAIASFHHRLVSIHPFLDGNGILARLLSSQQLGDLIGADVTLVERDSKYLTALRAADEGDIAPLVRYFAGASQGARAV